MLFALACGWRGRRGEAMDGIFSLFKWREAPWRQFWMVHLLATDPLKYAVLYIG